MSWPTAIAAGLALGAVAGAVFFGGLALTTARLGRTRRPVLLMLTSFHARLLVTAALLVLAVDAEARLVVGAIVGLLGVRFAATRPAVVERLVGAQRARQAGGATARSPGGDGRGAQPHGEH